MEQDVEDPLGSAEVREDEDPGKHHRNGRLEDRQPGDRLEGLHAEQPTGRRDDQAAGRQADEEHEEEDVLAPHDRVAHPGHDQAVGKLVDEGQRADDHQRDQQREPGGEAATRGEASACSCGGKGSDAHTSCFRRGGR